MLTLLHIMNQYLSTIKKSLRIILCQFDNKCVNSVVKDKLDCELQKLILLQINVANMRINSQLYQVKQKLFLRCHLCKHVEFNRNVNFTSVSSQICFDCQFYFKNLNFCFTYQFTKLILQQYFKGIQFYEFNNASITFNRRIFDKFICDA